MKETYWDPLPSERQYYRSPVDNQRAYLVRRNGKDMLRLDRPMEEILHPLTDSWKPDRQAYPINSQQIAYVAYVADQALCKALGKSPGKGEWLSLREKERIEWMDDGPADGSVRDDLYDAIMGTLKGLNDG